MIGLLHQLINGQQKEKSQKKPKFQASDTCAHDSSGEELKLHFFSYKITPKGFINS